MKKVILLVGVFLTFNVSAQLKAPTPSTQIALQFAVPNSQKIIEQLENDYADHGESFRFVPCEEKQPLVADPSAWRKSIPVTDPATWRKSELCALNEKTGQTKPVVLDPSAWRRVDPETGETNKLLRGRNGQLIPLTVPMDSSTDQTISIGAGGRFGSEGEASYFGVNHLKWSGRYIDFEKFDFDVGHINREDGMGKRRDDPYVTFRISTADNPMTTGPIFVEIEGLVNPTANERLVGQFLMGPVGMSPISDYEVEIGSVRFMVGLIGARIVRDRGQSQRIDPVVSAGVSFDPIQFNEYWSASARVRYTNNWANLDGIRSFSDPRIRSEAELKCLLTDRTGLHVLYSGSWVDGNDEHLLFVNYLCSIYPRYRPTVH